MREHVGLRWAEVKKVLRETICVALCDQGFPCAGHIMWRRRPEFVDVIQFRHINWSPLAFVIDVGSHPRGVAPAQPKPGECIFSTGIRHSDDTLSQGGTFRCAETLELQREYLLGIAPEVAAKAGEWFSRFTTVTEALRLLEESWSWNDLNGLRIGRRGSPMYERNVAKLRSISRTRDRLPDENLRRE